MSRRVPDRWSTSGGCSTSPLESYGNGAQHRGHKGAEMASDTSWMRNHEGMGVWEHRGKVAVVGWGQSYMDRRWDGVTMDRSCGGLSKEACLKAIADAGLSLDDIDGLITSGSSITRPCKYSSRVS